MGRRLRWAFAMCLAAAIVLTMAQTADAQESLAEARDLYAAAAYREALAMLDGLRTANHTGNEVRSIEQYRALCLFALGRMADAEHAIEAVVTAAPSSQVFDVDVSPQVRSVFRDVRQRMLPAIVEQKYGDAKAAFDRKDFGPARDGFRQVLDLLADSDLGAAVNQPPLSELRTLAANFVDLSTLRAAPPEALASARPLPPPAPAPLPRPAAPRIYDSDDSNVVPPVVLRQSFASLADVFALRQGMVEVIIDETGAVSSATMSMPVNAIYDRVALATAKSWRYRPATLDGVPVKFRKRVLIVPKAAR